MAEVRGINVFPDDGREGEAEGEEAGDYGEGLKGAGDEGAHG